MFWKFPPTIWVFPWVSSNRTGVTARDVSPREWSVPCRFLIPLSDAPAPGCGTVGLPTCPDCGSLSPNGLSAPAAWWWVDPANLSQFDHPLDSRPVPAVNPPSSVGPCRGIAPPLAPFRILGSVEEPHRSNISEPERAITPSFRVRLIRIYRPPLSSPPRLVSAQATCAALQGIVCIPLTRALHQG